MFSRQMLFIVLVAVSISMAMSETTAESAPKDDAAKTNETNETVPTKTTMTPAATKGATSTAPAMIAVGAIVCGVLFKNL